MASLQVRDLPENIYRRLFEAAMREHRSLAQQAVETLARGLGVESSPKSRRKQVIQELLASPIVTSKQKITNPVILIREDRNR